MLAWLSDAWPIKAFLSYHRVVETTFITRNLQFCGLCPFCEGPHAAVGFILNSEIFMGRAQAQELGDSSLLTMEPSKLSLGSLSSKSVTYLINEDSTMTCFWQRHTICVFGACAKYIPLKKRRGAWMFQTSVADCLLRVRRTLHGWVFLS